MVKLNLESMNPKHDIHFYAYYQNDVVVPSDLRKYGAAKEKITILPNHRQGRHYIIENTETLALDKPNERCTRNSSASRVSISKCISNFLEKEMRCSTRLLEGNQTMRTCGPEILENYKNSSDTILKHLSLLSEGNIFEYLGCMPSCHKNDIKLTKVKEFARTKDTTNTTLKLTFSFMDGGFDMKEEIYIYDSISLVADCGGYMGLLLGCSFLSIYQMVEDWVKPLFRREERHQMKALVNRKQGYQLKE